MFTGYRMLVSELYKTDWQTMIILDACRYDVFSEVYKDYFDGKLIKAETKSTSTDRWYKRYWMGEHKDKCLISMNPIYKREKIELGFGKIVEAWPGFEPIIAIDKYRELEWGGKVVIHLIPPHIPFLSARGKKVQGMAACRYEGHASHTITAYGRAGHWDTVKEIYRENAEHALQVLKDNWIFKGPVVITADHGELLGEGNFYGHGLGQEAQERAEFPELKRILTTVPWFEVADKKGEVNEIPQG